jgi:E3 ubiquitin-protein ligase HERC2
VRSVCAGERTAFTISEAGQLFLWGSGEHGLLGHGDKLNQPSPKRVEALRGNWVSSVSVEELHAMALTIDGLVCAWGRNQRRAFLANPNVEEELLPKPVEALRGVRVGSIAASCERSYAVANTGEVRAWGLNGCGCTSLDHDEQRDCYLPRPIESLRGIKVDAVAASYTYTLALADGGSVYAWGHVNAARGGALGLERRVGGHAYAAAHPQSACGVCGVMGFVCDVCEAAVRGGMAGQAAQARWNEDRSGAAPKSDHSHTGAECGVITESWSYGGLWVSCWLLAMLGEGWECHVGSVACPSASARPE